MRKLNRRILIRTNPANAPPSLPSPVFKTLMLKATETKLDSPLSQSGKLIVCQNCGKTGGTLVKIGGEYRHNSCKKISPRRRY